MTERSKARRKVKHQRNSNVLIRRIKSYNLKSYKTLKKIEQHTDTNYLRNIINRRNANQIKKEFMTLYKELRTMLILTRKEYLYYETLSHRLIENLEVTIARLSACKKTINRSSDKTLKDIDIERLRSNLKHNVLAGFKSNLWLGIKQARDAKNEHQTVREGISALLTEKRMFHNIKTEAKKVRKDVIFERGVKKKIKELPKDIKKILDSKSKNKKEEINKKLAIIKEEYEIMNDELSHLSRSTTTNIRIYFIILGIITNLDKLYSIINNSEKHIEKFPEKEMKELRHWRNKTMEEVEEYQKKEFALAKVLFKEFKKNQQRA